MSDGTFIKAENYSSYTETATPVGIVCHVNDDETTGYDTSFTAIIGTTIDGDTNGSDNWSKICTSDPEGSLDPATNYPVFNYALNYAATANITNTDYADGWYVPSVYELYNYVYPNKLTLNNSLNKVEGIQLYDDYYLTSTQYRISYNGAFYVDCNIGKDNINQKFKMYYVCCSRYCNTSPFFLFSVITFIFITIRV